MKRFRVSLTSAYFPMSQMAKWSMGLSSNSLLTSSGFSCHAIPSTASPADVPARNLAPQPHLPCALAPAPPAAAAPLLPAAVAAAGTAVSAAFAAAVAAAAADFSFRLAFLAFLAASISLLVKPPPPPAPPPAAAAVGRGFALAPPFAAPLLLPALPCFPAAFAAGTAPLAFIAAGPFFGVPAFFLPPPPADFLARKRRWAIPALLAQLLVGSGETGGIEGKLTEVEIGLGLFCHVGKEPTKSQKEFGRLTTSCTREGSCSGSMERSSIKTENSLYGAPENCGFGLLTCSCNGWLLP